MTLLTPWAATGPRISDRVVFEKLIQVLRFGCSYESIADCTCSATTIRERRDEWIRAGTFAKLKQIARDCYDRIVGLVLEELAVDGCIAKAPGGCQCAGRSCCASLKIPMEAAGGGIGNANVMCRWPIGGFRWRRHLADEVTGR